jgi:hypothetical protein
MVNHKISIQIINLKFILIEIGVDKLCFIINLLFFNMCFSLLENHKDFTPIHDVVENEK